MKPLANFQNACHWFHVLTTFFTLSVTSIVSITLPLLSPDFICPPVSLSQLSYILANVLQSLTPPFFHHTYPQILTCSGPCQKHADGSSLLMLSGMLVSRSLWGFNKLMWVYCLAHSTQ